MTTSTATRLHPSEANILATYFAASSEQISRAVWGQNSYRAIRSRCEDIALHHHTALRTVVAVVAVLSPIITWEQNIIEAETLVARPVFTPTSDLSAIPANIRKARAILSGRSAVTVMRGRKVWNFYHSILHPANPVTVCVDRHVARAAIGWGTGWRAVDTYLKSPGAYNTVADLVRSAARTVSLHPPELQALLWLVVRENPFQMRLEL